MPRCSNPNNQPFLLFDFNIKELHTIKIFDFFSCNRGENSVCEEIHPKSLLLILLLIL